MQVVTGGNERISCVTDRLHVVTIRFLKETEWMQVVMGAFLV